MAIVINGQTGIDAGHLPISNAGNTEIEGTLTGADVTVASITANSVITQGQNVSPFSGFKNYIINGGFDVWQRGTSFTSGNSKYTADHWLVNANNVCLRIDTRYSNQAHYTLKSKAAAAGSLYCQQPIENGARLLAGRTMTLSFDIIGVGITSITVVTGESDDSNLVYSSSIPVTTTLTRHSVELTIPSSFTSDSNYRYIRFLTTATASNDYFEIGNVQLEEGSVATPFEQRPYGLELALCQRYYQAFSENELSFTFDAASNPAVGNSYMSRRYTSLSTIMRTSPTVTILNLNHGLTGAPLVYAKPNVLCVSTHPGGYNNGSNPYVYLGCSLDAEL